ncbi:hypothetical protein I7I48_00088 [Histoplasma ohiense]|nr:hypothetical protein I7I48_00088 [Histoplasma ohiense (nom. inval.)]
MRGGCWATYLRFWICLSLRYLNHMFYYWFCHYRRLFIWLSPGIYGFVLFLSPSPHCVRSR